MNELDGDLAARMIGATARRVAEAADQLSSLDAVAGDGDHGVNVATAFTDAEVWIAEHQPTSAADVFWLVSRSFSEGSGGSAGLLFGAVFETLRDRLKLSAAPGATDLADGLELASRRVALLGRTAPGGKTMLDALQPAAHAAGAAVAAGGQLHDAINAAAAASELGANATAEMRATAGRARYAPDGALGARDPGAATVAIMFSAWAEVAGPHGESVRATDRAARLDRLATLSGQFAILALDHNRSFATTLRPQDPESLSPNEILHFKGRLVEGLASEASAILMDPGLASRRLSAAVPTSPKTAPFAGLLVGIEDGDYEVASAPRLLPGWTVDRAARLGADGVKISVQFDPDRDTSVAEGFVREVARQCDLVDLPLFCEPLAPRNGGPDVRRHVLEGIRRFGSLGADVLKIQFPCETEQEQSRDSWAEACAEADELSPKPWALLSEGRDYVEFRELLAIACRAGASGFVAGRAIWGSAARDGAVEASAARLTELRSIAIAEGRSWRTHRPGGGDVP
jgi:tagatose 1,6-diphosphate aldolase